MKKLLFLFTTLLLISCSSNSSEKKDEIQVDEIFGDYWLSKGSILYNKEGKINYIDGSLYKIKNPEKYSLRSLIPIKTPKIPYIKWGYGRSGFREAPHRMILHQFHLQNPLITIIAFSF